MLVIYKELGGTWVRVGQLSPVEYDTDEKIVKGIKKLESSYLFSHHVYSVYSPNKPPYLLTGMTPKQWDKLELE